MRASAVVKRQLTVDAGGLSCRFRSKHASIPRSQHRIFEQWLPRCEPVGGVSARPSGVGRARRVPHDFMHRCKKNRLESLFRA
jgi:hypothetical protein